MFLENYDKKSDLLAKSNLRKYIINSNLINGLDNDFGNKLEFDYQQHFGNKGNNSCRVKKKLSQGRQPKHTIADILGIKQQPERKKEKMDSEMQGDSDRDSVYGQLQVRSTSPDYKSGLSIFGFLQLLPSFCLVFQFVKQCHCLWSYIN